MSNVSTAIVVPTAEGKYRVVIVEDFLTMYAAAALLEKLHDVRDDVEWGTDDVIGLASSQQKQTGCRES